MAELKPCPFCGHKAHIYEHEEITLLATKMQYMATCIHCLTKSRVYPTYEQAERAWNRRVAEDD